MFGQQPQQYGGYGRQPQQAYGQPPYGGFQQPTPQASGSLDDLVAGRGAKSFFDANSQPGASVSGVIDLIEKTQYRDYNTKQPGYWNDGKLMEQIHVILQTQLRDPSVDDDDGRRSVWIKGWGVQLGAFRAGMRLAGMQHAPRKGDRMTATFTGFDPKSKNPQNPAKLYEYVFEPANSVNGLVNQPQQPAQPAFQQQAQQGYPQQYAPQQAAQAPNQGYQPAPTDPWNPPAQQQPQQPAQPVQLGQQQPQVDPMKVSQLKALGKPPQEIAALLGVPVEAVTAVTDQAQPQNHGGSEQMPETGEF